MKIQGRVGWGIGMEFGKPSCIGKSSRTSLIIILACLSHFYESMYPLIEENYKALNLALNVHTHLTGHTRLTGHILNFATFVLFKSMNVVGC